MEMSKNGWGRVLGEGAGGAAMVMMSVMVLDGGETAPSGRALPSRACLARKLNRDIRDPSTGIAAQLALSFARIRPLVVEGADFRWKRSLLPSFYEGSNWEGLIKCVRVRQSHHRRAQLDWP